ncbi:unnamed protein product, partial [marine sediment metagenome]
TTYLQRNGFDSLDIDATLDGNSYNVTSYLSILPYSYYNEEGTINKTFTLAVGSENVLLSAIPSELETISIVSK